MKLFNESGYLVNNRGFVASVNRTRVIKEMNLVCGSPMFLCTWPLKVG